MILRKIPLLLLLLPAAICMAQTNRPPQNLEEARKLYAERIHQSVLAERQMNSFWYKTNGDVLAREAANKLLVRPAGMEDDGWEQYQLMLEMLMEINLPIQFYGRVVDQNGQPVSGAGVEFHVTGVDTDKVLAKYPHMNMGDEQVTWTNVLVSDANGWIRMTNAAGHYLAIWKYPSKEGYTSKYPNENFGTLIYETTTILTTNGPKRIPHYNISISDLTTDAFNPAKGFVFHLQKTNTVSKP